MAIKKPFVELVNLLEANKSKKVSDIMSLVLELAEAKKQANTFIKDANGKIVAIFCYYHKQWEILADVEYGTKKNSTTGFNTMCKVGVNKWTQAQSTAKKEKESILNGVANGAIDPSNIVKLMDDVEAKRNTINKVDMPKGYANEELVLKALDKK